MPTQSYPFEPNGPKRLELSWSAFWKNFTVKVDGQQVGALTPEELKAGKTLALADGSSLTVHLKQGFANTGLQLSRNGKPLPGTMGDPETMAKGAGQLLYFLAGLNVLLGAVALAFNVELLLNLGMGIPSIVIGFIFAVLGFFTMQRSLAALIAAIVLYALDGIVGLVMTAAEGGRPGVGGIFVRVFFIIILARGVTGLRLLKAQKAAG